MMFHCRLGSNRTDSNTRNGVGACCSPCETTGCQQLVNSYNSSFCDDKRKRFLPSPSADCRLPLPDIHSCACPLFIPPMSVKASFEIFPHYISETRVIKEQSAGSKDKTIDPAGSTVKADDELDTDEPMDILSRSFVEFATKDGYICIYCGKLYSRKYGLKIHLRTHTGYKPLKCKICHRAFGDPSNLNKHVRLHSQGAAPYRCFHCGKVLVRRRDLARHLKSRHPHKVSKTDIADFSI